METGFKCVKARQLRAFLVFREVSPRKPDCLAGPGGFEPPYGGIKIRHPSDFALDQSFPQLAAAAEFKRLRYEPDLRGDAMAITYPPS